MPADAPVPEPQFAAPGPQRDASLLGMWAFLAAEVLLFGGLITAFLVYRHAYPADFQAAAGRLNVLVGGTNTVVLLTSSLTMALAVRADTLGHRRSVAGSLAWAAAFGATFLGLKAYERGRLRSSGFPPGLTRNDLAPSRRFRETSGARIDRPLEGV